MQLSVVTFFHFQYLLPTPISQSSRMDYMIIVVQQNHLGDSSLFSCDLPDVVLLK